MSTATTPVFIHSLFRSGSTYLFTVFRRARDEHGGPRFTAFQEALHEEAVAAKGDPARLLEMGATGEDQAYLRHPQIGGPYFKELFDTHAGWADVLDERSIYDVFGADAFGETVAYFQALSATAKEQPVFQECRTSLRIAKLREAMGGIHIHLWRNPWDQWWSMRVALYFDMAIQMFLNAPGPPASVQLLRNRIQFPLAPGASIPEKFDFYRFRPLVPTVSYKSFYLIWLLSLEHGLKNTQVDINIESLSASAEYRQHTVETLRELGIDGIELEDSAAPMSHFGETDRAFFEPLEQEVHQIVRVSGWSQEQLDRLLEVRKAHEPSARQIQRSAEGLKKTLAQVRATYLRTERDRASDAHRGAGEIARLTGRLHQSEAEVGRFSESLRAALDAQAAEASDNRIRLDAELLAAKGEINTTHARLREALGEREVALADGRDAHLRLQAALLERDAAQTEINETHVRLRDALEKLEGAHVEIRDTHLRLQAHEDAVRAGEAREAELLSEANEARAVLLREANEAKAMMAAERADNVAMRDKIERIRRNTEHARAALLGEIAALRQAMDEETVARHHQLNQLANKFRTTLSWRLTAPVRGASTFARSALQGVKGAARRLAHSGLGLVRRYPWMKRPVLAAVSVSPALKKRLVVYGQRHAPPGAALPKVLDRLMLTPDPGIVAVWAAELNRQGATENSGRAA